MAEPWEGNGLVWGGLRFLSKTKVAVLGMTAVLFWPVVPAGSSLVPLWENREQLAQQEEMPADSTRREAERLLKEGLQLAQQGTAESLRQAIQKWEEALPLLRVVGDKVLEATILTAIGKTYDDFGDNQQALSYYNQALPLSREVGDKALEAMILTGIGEVYDALGDKQKALSYLNQSLPLRREVGDKALEASILNSIGAVYSDLGDKQKALDYYNQSLSLSREVGNKKTEAATLSNIGLVYSDLGDKQKALSYLNQSLPLRREVGDKAGEAATLHNIGGVYSDLGDKQQALSYFNQSLPLSQEVGDKALEAVTLSSIGQVYSDLGENQKALSYFNQSLSLSREVGDKAGEAVTLNNIGRVYNALGDKQKALSYFNQSLPLSREVGHKALEAATLNNIGRVYDALGDKQQALSYYNQSLPLSREVGYKALEAVILNSIGQVYDALGDKQQALDYYNQSLSLSREVVHKAQEAVTLSSIGKVYSNLGDKQQALSYYNQSLPLLRVVGDKAGEAATLHNIGRVYSDLGDKQQALDYYNQSLSLSREVNDKAGEASTLNSIGRVYDDLGEKQKALDYFNQSLSLSREVGDKALKAATLHNIGGVYDDLGEKQKALDYYNQALPLSREVGDKAGEATTLNNIGKVYSNLGDKQQALYYFNQSLLLSQKVGNKAQEVATLNNIGQVYSDLGDKQQALDYYNQALPLSREVGYKAGEATILNNIGGVYNDLGDKQKALDNFNQSLSLSREVGDKDGEARILHNIAFFERNRGNLNEALNQIKAAAEIIENLRTNIGSSELRASFFATKQDTFGLYIDILMALHKQNPNAGYDIAAFDVSERARARSLLELLNEARADIRQGVNPELREEERRLQQLLTGKTQYQDQLLKGDHTEAQVETIRQEIAELETQLQQVEAQILATSPRYAALTQPQPLTLKEVQQQIVDADSILLSYWLGEERSYLWVITPTSFTVRELPKRADIETAAQEFLDYLAPAFSDSADASVKAATLSKIILAPVAEQLQQKRLLIVADGGLQYVPFSALPVPVQPAAETTQLLIAEHEIVSLPSASTLSIIRRDTADRQPAPKAVAVLADPVFSAEDSRVNGTPTPQTPPLFTPNLTRGTDSEGADWARLLGTRQEAERILSLVADSEKMQAFDFDANLDQATDSVLSNYRVVHFATHGFLNSENPQLSGIVFSLVNQFGVPQDGYLLTPAVFNLNLPAELVVLSGCETGKGNKVKGEGIVGLTRGFMYAGAKRVMVSLWSVSDQQGTPELMSRFYQKMLQDGLSPAQALREAQLSMIREGKEAYYWAPFILQGEWK